MCHYKYEAQQQQNEIRMSGLLKITCSWLTPHNQFQFAPTFSKTENILESKPETETSL